MSMAYNSLGSLAGTSDLKQRLSKALLDISGTLASVKSGALVQVWMPEHTHDGTIVLSCQGLPFAVAGVGDLLALFRCVSVRYRFSTDVMKPSLMGAIGRVYSTLEPEMSHNVQKYDKQVYLRVSEAQRCRVHSTLMVPIFGSDSRDTPLAVFELVQGDRDVTFPAIISQLITSLQSVYLYTTDLETAAGVAGLRKWPMHINMAPASEYGGGLAGRLSPTCDGPPRRINSVARIEELPNDDKEQAASSQVVATEEKYSPTGSRGDEAGSWPGERPSQLVMAARMSAGHTGVPSISQQAGSGPLMQLSADTHPTGPLSGGGAGLHPALLPVASAGPPGAGGPTFGAGLKKDSLPGTGKPQEPSGQGAGGGMGGQRPSPVPPLDTNNAQQLMSWLMQQGASGNNALTQLRALLEAQQQQPQAQQQNAEQQPGTAVAAPQQAAGLAVPPRAQQVDAQALAAARASGSPPTIQAASPTNDAQQQQQPQASFDPAAAIAAVAAAAGLSDKQNKMGRSGSMPRPLCGSADADDGDGEDISSGGEDDDSDDERAGGQRNNNRVGGGAGKRLRFEDLQAQFGLGLKEAANNLGICATTLKRACRRHGIKRWPRRQIAKLSKALNQMGYNGAPPPGLAQNAVVAGQQAAANKPKPVKKPDPVALQHATHLLFQQQLGAAVAGGGGGIFPNMAPAGVMMGGQLQGLPSHGLYAVAGHPGQHQQHHPQQQQPQGMFPGAVFMGPMGPMMAQHAGGGGAPGGQLGQGHQVLLGGMGGGMSNGMGSAMQMQGMGALGGMQGGALGSLQAAALGMHLNNGGVMQMQGGGAAGLQQVHGSAGMLHPLLSGGAFNMHHALQQQQQLQQQQFQAQQQQQHQQQQHQQQQHQQRQHQQQQHQHQQHQQQQHQQHFAVQSQQQMQPHAIVQQQHPVPNGPVHHTALADGMSWMAPAPGSSSAAGVGMAPSAVPAGPAAAAPMDVAAHRVSCADAASPFNALVMSPGMSGGLSEIPEDFIQNLNSSGTGQGQLSQLLKGSNMNVGMELLDLLGDDVAAR